VPSYLAPPRPTAIPRERHTPRFPTLASAETTRDLTPFHVARHSHRESAFNATLAPATRQNLGSPHSPALASLKPVK
jgi:hypothetical protein